MTQKPKKQHHSLYLSPRVSESVKKECEATSRSFSLMVEYMIEQYLKNGDQK